MNEDQPKNFPPLILAEDTAIREIQRWCYTSPDAFQLASLSGDVDLYFKGKKTLQEVYEYYQRLINRVPANEQVAKVESLLPLSESDVQAVLEDPICNLPREVSLSDLQANGKLLSDEDIAKLIDDKEYYKKTDHKIPFSVLSINGRKYAIYKGKHHVGKILGAGSFGTVKLAQDLETGEWFALKVIPKFEFLKRVNRTKASEALLESIANGGLPKAQILSYESWNKIPKHFGYYRKDKLGIENDVLLANQVLVLIEKGGKKFCVRIEKIKEVESGARILDFEVTGCAEIQETSVSNDESDIEELNRELEILQRLDFSNTPLVELSNKNLILMKLIRGRNLVEKFALANITSAFDFYTLILSALDKLKMMHDVNILHLDIKPANMIVSEGNIMLVDFGHSRVIPGRGNGVTLATLLGTRGYLSPEVDCYSDSYLGEPILYTKKMDIYAMGVTIYQILEIVKRNFEPSDAIGVIIQKVEEQVTLMCADDPSVRPDVDSCIKIFQDLQAECLQTLGKFKRIGIVRLSELTQGSTESFISPLLLCHKIYILDDFGANDQQNKPGAIEALRKKFGEKNIPIAGIVKNEHVVLAIEQLEHSRKKEEDASDNINRYIYFSKNNSEKNELVGASRIVIQDGTSSDSYDAMIKAILGNEHIKPKDFHNLMKSLHEEIKRTENVAENAFFGQKVYKNRKYEILETRKGLLKSYQEKKLTYALAVEMLTELEKKMIHANPFKRAASIFFAAPQAKKNIAAIAKDFRPKKS